MASEKNNLTVLGQQTEFNGVLEFTDNLVITGKFNGSIKATGDLEINKTAVCKVDKMTAESIVVSGKIEGDIEGKERVELCNGSKVKGNITTSRLRIADKVEFEGQVEMIDQVPDTDIFSVASQEFRNALKIETKEAH